MNVKAVLRLNKPETNNPLNLHFQNYDLMHCEYFFTKDADKKGFVSDNIITGNIVIGLPMLPNDEIMSWVLDATKRYDGEISVNNDSSESLEKIIFEDARPINFRLHYEPGDSTSVILILTIHARRIIIGESEYQNK